MAFREGQDLVSLIGTFTNTRLAALVGPAPKLSRAIPLPFVERGIGATPIYPPTSMAKNIFDRLGGSILISDEVQLDQLLAASATMGTFFVSA